MGEVSSDSHMAVAQPFGCCSILTNSCKVRWQISLKVPHGHFQPPAVHLHCWNGFTAYRQVDRQELLFILAPDGRYEFLCVELAGNALPVGRVFQLSSDPLSYLGVATPY